MITPYDVLLIVAVSFFINRAYVAGIKVGAERMIEKLKSMGYIEVTGKGPDEEIFSGWRHRFRRHDELFPDLVSYVEDRVTEGCPRAEELRKKIDEYGVDKFLKI